MDDWIRIVCSAIAASVLTVLGFAPRLSRVERDVNDKLDKEVFIEVRRHIDDKFKAQEELLKVIHASIKDKKGGGV